jgi:hypothetical protein
MPLALLLSLAFSLVGLANSPTPAEQSQGTEHTVAPAKRRFQFGLPLCSTGLIIAHTERAPEEELRRSSTIEAMRVLRAFRKDTLGVDNDVAPNTLPFALDNSNVTYVRKSLAGRIRGLELNAHDGAGAWDQDSKQTTLAFGIVGKEDIQRVLDLFANDPSSPWKSYWSQAKAFGFMMGFFNLLTGFVLGAPPSMITDNPAYYSGITIGLVPFFASFFAFHQYQYITAFRNFHRNALRFLENPRNLPDEKLKEGWLYLADNAYVPLKDEKSGKILKGPWIGLDLFFHYRDATEKDGEELQGKTVPELLLFSRFSETDPSRNYPRKPKRKKQEEEESSPAWQPGFISQPVPIPIRN